MCRFYCIVFAEFILAVKTLLSYTALFSCNNLKKSSKIIYKYFKEKAWQINPQVLHLD